MRFTSQIFLFILLICSKQSLAQSTLGARPNRFADLTVSAASAQGSWALSYVHNWKVLKKKKWELGLGLRYTGYAGQKKDFITAGPARLTRTSTTPFLIFFAGQKTQNWDTLAVQQPFTNSFNVTANLGYNFNKHWYAGFNIDLIGYTFGKKTSAILTGNGITRTEANAKPTPFNLLLTGDHDKGSLNSEFFVKYHFKNRWSVKAVYQFLFIEYKTQTIKQVATDGTVISTFRNKVNAAGLGISYTF